MTMSNLRSNSLLPVSELPNANFSNTPTGSYSSSGVDYKYVRFTTTSTLTITDAGVADVLVVAGGGGGGNFNVVNGGGGGAGGYVYRSSFYLPSGSLSVVVGGGGAFEGVGNGSYIAGLLFAIGGGRGHTIGYYGDGASAGQLWGRASQQIGQGSIGASDAAGISGGSSGNVGGGGSSANGSGTTGGAGTVNTITNSSVTYAAGGSSGANNSGTANTGNGAGGLTSGQPATSGGSGVVIVRVRTN